MTFLPQWKSFELLPKVLRLTGPYQRICEEHFDRFGFVDAIATPIWIEIAPLFKRIELSVGDVDRSPMETACSATSEGLDSGR